MLFLLLASAATAVVAATTSAWYCYWKKSHFAEIFLMLVTFPQNKDFLAHSICVCIEDKPQEVK